MASGRSISGALRVLAQRPALSSWARGGPAPRAPFPTGRLPARVCGAAASKTEIGIAWRDRFAAVPRTGAAALGCSAHVRALAVLGRGTALQRSALPVGTTGEAGASGKRGDRSGDGGRRKFHFRQYQGWEGDGPKPPIWTLLTRPLLFAGAFTLGSFAVAAIWRDESRRRPALFDNPFGRTPSRRATHNFFGFQLSTAEVVVWSIIGANCAVSLCWMRSMRGQQSFSHAYPWLQRYFLHYPFSGRALPMLFSSFSHMTALHLLFNMMALHSFAPGFVQALGPENFLASYLSACVLSSLGGMMVKLATVSTYPTLGASGGVLYLASSVALLFPQAKFAIMFIPFISFPAPTLLLAVVAFDITGLVLRWRSFDHGAHLAAVACGVVFVNGGAHLIAQWQVMVVKKWRQVRRSIHNSR